MKSVTQSSAVDAISVDQSARKNTFSGPSPPLDIIKSGLTQILRFAPIPLPPTTAVKFERIVQHHKRCLTFVRSVGWIVVGGMDAWGTCISIDLWFIPLPAISFIR